MPATVRTIVGQVITDLSQVPGIATQIYSTPMIQQHVESAFLLEFEDLWWPNYMTYARSSVDGTTGLLTVDLRGPLGPISEYGDIHSVWPGDSTRKLREVSQSMNPFAFVGGSTQSWYMSPDYTVPNRPFRVWPPSASGDVVVWGRQRPTLPFALDDMIYMDPLLLRYGALWMYAVDDGTIPAQVNKFQVLAANRRKRIHSSFSQQPIPLDPRFASGDMFSEIDATPFVLDQDPLA